MSEYYTRAQMIDATVSHLTTLGYSVLPPYSDDFKPARVPIYAIKKHKGPTSPGPSDASPHIFVDIISEKQIDGGSYFEDIEFDVADDDNKLKIKDANSGLFFRHYFKKAQVYWAVPAYSTITGNFQEFRKKCISSGIGIFVVSKKDDDSFEVKIDGNTPIPLIEERFNLLNSAVESILGKKTNNRDKKRIANIIEGFSFDDLKYLVFYPKPIYGAIDLVPRSQEFSVSGELLNKITELKHIGYRGILKKFASNYYRENKDPYESALHVTKELWGKYDLVYPDLHKDFESILKLNPRYRDHFLHAFQVFLCGIYIIDAIYDNIPAGYFTKKFGNRIEDAWLIASTYHDYAYAVEKFKTWSSTFFKGALHFTGEKAEHATLQLAEPYVKEGFMIFTKEIINSLDLKIDNILLDFIYKRILEDKNHALMSALSLAKYISITSKQKLDKRVLIASYKAIAMHDPGIWKFMAGQADKKYLDEPIAKSMNDRKFIPEIKFYDDIISSLLNICDCIQEEGRIGAKYIENGAVLEKLSFEGGKILIEISFNGKNHKAAFDDKVKEIEGVKDFIKADDLFRITIRNAKTNSKREESI